MDSPNSTTPIVLAISSTVVRLNGLLWLQWCFEPIQGNRKVALNWGGATSSEKICNLCKKNLKSKRMQTRTRRVSVEQQLTVKIDSSHSKWEIDSRQLQSTSEVTFVGPNPIGSSSVSQSVWDIFWLTASAAFISPRKPANFCYRQRNKTWFAI